MAAVHKLILDDFFEEDFTLLAIHSPLETYRLAYACLLYTSDAADD